MKEKLGIGRVGEICADCGKQIEMLESSYYRKGPADDIGKTYHSTCGDPFGVKAKDAEIERLRETLRKIADHDYTARDEMLTSRQPAMIWQLVARDALSR